MMKDINKKIKIETQQVDAGKIIKHTVSYYNFVIFVVLVSISLIATIVILANTFLNPTIESTPTTDTNASQLFDQTTISKLNRLETSDKNNNFNINIGGRTSPFSE